MKTESISRKVLACAMLGVACMALRPAAGHVLTRPIEYSLSSEHVIVAGTMVEVTRDKKVERKLGSDSYTDYYRLGYVQVDEVLKNDLAHFTIQPGDRVEIELGATLKRARKLYRQRLKDRRFIMSETSLPSRSIEKGDPGIWRLRLSSSGQRPVFALSSRMKMERLGQVKAILSQIERDYQAALKDEIPRYAEMRRKFLASPAVTQAMANAVMGTPIPPEVDLSDVYVVNHGPMQTLFVANTGEILGGVPYFATARVFTEGYLPIATVLDRGYGHYNFLGRNGKLLCDKFYAHAEPFSQGLALVGFDNRYGYVDTTGKERMVCTHSYAQANTMLDNIRGRPSQSDGLTKIATSDKGRGVVLYGFADEQGATVIPPTFLGAMDFSEAMAAVQATVWAERSDYHGNPAVVLSEKAPRHLLTARWGFVNPEGDLVVPPLFDGVGPFQNGLANVRIDLRARDPRQDRVFEGLIDKTGNLVFVKCNPAL